jgi:hypothetical protein
MDESDEDRGLRDAAKRASEAYNLHRVADPHGSVRKWLSIKLQDGSCDGVLYDSKAEAVRHVSDERFYAFVQVGPWPFTEKEAAIFLKKNRLLYEKGVHMADPDHKAGGMDFIPRLTAEDEYRRLRALFIGDTAPSNLILPSN